jgi:hypothetical protein
MPDTEPSGYSFVQPSSPFIVKEKMASTGYLAMKNKMASTMDLTWNLGNVPRKSVGYRIKNGPEV